MHLREIPLSSLLSPLRTATVKLPPVPAGTDVNKGIPDISALSPRTNRGALSYTYCPDSGYAVPPAASRLRWYAVVRVLVIYSSITFAVLLYLR